MKPLKCLMLTTFYPPYHLGGDALHVYNLSNELAKLRHEVHVIHSIDAYYLSRRIPHSGNYLNHEKVFLHPLESRLGVIAPLISEFVGLSHPLSRQALKVVEEIKPDVIHHHNITAFGNGVAKLYSWPRILTDNYQVTRTEIAGMDWLFDKKDTSLAILAHCLPPGRFADFLLTREEISQRQDLHPGYGGPPPSRSRYGTPLPSHFGYDKGSWLGEYYSDNAYMVLGNRDRLRYVEVYPGLAKYRYYPDDFERLEGDPTVNKLYSNGGLDVYLVYGAGMVPRPKGGEQ